MPVLDRALDRDPVPGQVLVLEQAPVLDQVLVMEQGLRALEQAAQAWVLDQGQVLVREVSGPVALKGRMATDLVMEPATVVLVLQTVPALAQAPARADTDPAPVANNSTLSSIL